jgi:hypothetical protein
VIANGYTTIEISGRKVGLKFNMYAIEQFEQVKGRAGNIKNFTTIIWAGLLGNAYVKQIEPELTFEDISDWVDEQILMGDESGELNRISEVFLNSQVLQATIKKAQSNGDIESEVLKKKIVTQAP